MKTAILTEVLTAVQTWDHDMVAQLQHRVRAAQGCWEVRVAANPLEHIAAHEDGGVVDLALFREGRQPAPNDDDHLETATLRTRRGFFGSWGGGGGGGSALGQKLSTEQRSLANMSEQHGARRNSARDAASGL